LLSPFCAWSVATTNDVRRCAISEFSAGVVAVFDSQKILISNIFSFGNFCKNERGTIAVTAGLCATALMGFAALAIDVASWQTAQRSMQGAADMAAYSAGIANNTANGTSYVTQAKGITAALGYVASQNGVTVSVNQPPTSGNYTSSVKAIEVIIQQPQPRYFASLFLSSNPTVKARAVATMTGNACALAGQHRQPGNQSQRFREH
jgi:uncharacterized membrane protein